MKGKLVIVMDNRVEYECFETFNMESRDDFVEIIKEVGFFKPKNITDKNFVSMGLSNGKNVIVDEDKVSSFEFR